MSMLDPLTKLYDLFQPKDQSESRQASKVQAPASSSHRCLFINPTCPPQLLRADGAPWTVKDFKVKKKYTSSDVCSVYMAEAIPSRTKVILKVFALDKLSPMDRHQMAREVYVHSQLEHRNVIKLYGVVEDRQTICMVMEHADGGDLRQKLSSVPGHRLSEEETKPIALQLLSALVYLHSKMIVHRDVKPENILIGTDGQYKLADFGLSIDMSKERPVSPVGTGPFVAPEVVRCPGKSRPSANKNDESLFYGPEADIWAVGIVVLQLVTGKVPSIDPLNGLASDVPDLKLPDSGLSLRLRAFLEKTNARWPCDRPRAATLRADPWMKAPSIS